MQGDKVNVRVESDGSIELVARVNGATERDGLFSGWHYDDPDAPLRIVLCPSTCTRTVEHRTVLTLGCPQYVSPI